MKKNTSQWLRFSILFSTLNPLELNTEGGLGKSFKKLYLESFRDLVEHVNEFNK